MSPRCESYLKLAAGFAACSNLHAKLYLFGRKRAIITSCNLTKAALEKNRELGIVTSDSATVEKCLDYFDKLWSAAGDDLQLNQVDDWDRTVTKFWLEGGRPTGEGGLGDYGADTRELSMRRLCRYRSLFPMHRRHS